MTSKEAKAAKFKEAWAKRTQIKLTLTQSARLTKGKKVPVMVGGHFHEIQVSMVPEVFDANGKKLTRGKLKRLLRTVR